MERLEFLAFDYEFDDGVPISKKKTLQPVYRDVVYCTDVEGLIFFLKISRLLDDDAIVKIGIDGGQGSLKICLTIHSQKEEDEKQRIEEERLRSPTKKVQKKRRSSIDKDFKNSGIKKLMILALVEQLPERYENVDQLLGLLNIEEFTFYCCCDLKLQNVLAGINAHGSTYPCAYCFGKRPDYLDAKARPRTFGEIRQYAHEFANARPKDQIPKNFFNCTNKPILKVPDDKKVQDVLVPAELHLDIGIVCKVFFKANGLMKDMGFGKDKVKPMKYSISVFIILIPI